MMDNKWGERKGITAMVEDEESGTLRWTALMVMMMLASWGGDEDSKREMSKREMARSRGRGFWDRGLGIRHRRPGRREKEIGGRKNMKLVTCHMRDRSYYFFLFFLLGYKRPGLCNFGRVWVNLAQSFSFRHSFTFFEHFSRIIQYLQNKIKSNKNLKITIISSIN